MRAAADARSAVAPPMPPLRTRQRNSTLLHVLPSLLAAMIYATAAAAQPTTSIRSEPLREPDSAASNASSNASTDPAAAASDSGLVFLPLPSLPVEMLCVTIYLSLATVAACKALALPTRYSAYEVKRRHTFQRLMALFALTRALSFLATAIVRDLLNRAALCFFFSLVLFQVLFWIDIANPKISRRSKRIWYAFVLANGVFYALVLGLSLLHVSHVYSNDNAPQSHVVNDVLPVLVVAAGSLASALGLVYSTCKMRRRVGRVLQQTGDGGQRRRLDDRVTAKLHRALRFTLAVMVLCSVLFVLRTLLYVQRPFAHRGGCGAIENPNVCVLVGYVVPEVVPCVLFLLLMWEVEPDMQFPSARRRPSTTNLASESTPLLFDDQPPLSITTALPVASGVSGASPSPSASAATHRVTNRRPSPLSSGLGGNVLEQARRRLEIAAQRTTAVDGHSDPLVHSHTHAMHAPPLGDTRLVNSSGDLHASAATDRAKKRSTSAHAAIPTLKPIGAEAATLSAAATATALNTPSPAHAWLSFQCFNLNLPSSSATAASFVVLHVLDADTGDVVVEIGRSEVSTSEDPCFHLMLPVEMRASDLLRLSVYSVRNAQALHDIQSQWLVGDALVPLASFVAAGTFAFGRATLHALFSPLSRSQSSGEIVVRCEAAVTSASGVLEDDGRQRTTRSFMYFSVTDDSDEQAAHHVRTTATDTTGTTTAGSAGARRKSDVAASLQHCHAKVLVEEELIESVYTWEVPYQLLQLILSDLVVKLEALKRDNVGASDSSAAASLSSTPISQVSSFGMSAMPPPLSTSPGGLSVVPESDGDDGFMSSEDDDHATAATLRDSSAATGAAGTNDPTRRSTPSIGMLSELIFQIQDDAMERKKRKWRHELVATMETYISEVEDAILRYGDTQHAGLTFKPSTMKADADLRFLAVNLHQQLMTVGSAVPTSPRDVIYGDSASSGVRYARLVDSFVGTIVASPMHHHSRDTGDDGDPSDDAIATIHDLDNENHNHVDGSADSDGESDRDDSAPAASTTRHHRNARERDESPVEPVEALRRRVVSFDSAENIVNMSASGRGVPVTDEQRKLAETIVALGISERNVHALLSSDVDALNSASSAGPQLTKLKPKTEGLTEWMKRKWREVEETRHSHDEQQSSHESRAPFAHHRMYGTTTVGAFAAHVYGFKHGGIRQMRVELERIHAELMREAEQASSDLTLEALERKYHELKWHVERRLEVAFCQAMSALVTCFQQTLYAHVHDGAAFGTHALELRGLAYLEMVTQLGFLFSVESLLSTYSHEAGMLGDMEAAVKELSRVLIKLRPVQTPREAAFRVSVTSGPLGIVIELPIIVCDPLAYPDRNMHRVPGQDAVTGAVYCPLTTSAEIDRAKRVFRRTISVRAVLFSQGMNEMQTVANTVGRDALQREINAENVVVLERYYASFVLWCEKRMRNSDRSATPVSPVYAAEDLNRLARLVERLKTNIQLSGRSKRMAILSLSSLIARSIGGGRVTCCKSAKDRTSMSITLEEANLLVLSHGLHSDERDALTSLLRTYGVRRENARKNIGKAQYCFSALQNYMLPNDYKCPPGTGGGSRSFS